MSRCNANLSNDEKCKMLRHVRYEIESFFLSPLSDSDPILKTNEQLRESLEMRRVVHCRALLDFFYKKAALLREDDLSASDYGYSSRRGVSDTDRDRFNKDIFHITTARLTRTPQDKTWPIKAVFPALKRECNEFIDDLIRRGLNDINCSDGEKNEWIGLKSKISEGACLSFATGNTSPILI